MTTRTTRRGTVKKVEIAQDRINSIIISMKSDTITAKDIRWELRLMIEELSQIKIRLIMES